MANIARMNAVRRERKVLICPPLISVHNRLRRIDIYKVITVFLCKIVYDCPRLPDNVIKARGIFVA